MSDLLSPILVTMMDEAHAYVCFCSLMQRLRKNFMVDGLAMTKMFQHLSEGLMYYDPEFFAYLKINQADDLLFCYRWLLLEMKRELDLNLYQGTKSTHVLKANYFFKNHCKILCFLEYFYIFSQFY